MTRYDEPAESIRFAHRFEIARSWLAEHRSVAAFFATLVLFLAFGAAFETGARNTKWAEKAIHLAQPGSGLPIDFAPEVWLALVAMVLGTLIIVISISSQSTPKLIDLYMRDWLSLAYLWFMLMAMIQNIYLQNAGEADWDGRLAAFLNTYIYLPVALGLALPYIFYILANTKTSRVIQRIHKDNLGRINLLADRMTSQALEDPGIARNYQLQLFESFNQFDDLLQYTSFKEPKALIMTRIGSALRKYVAIKPDIPPSFFKVSPEALEDISFLTIRDQRRQIESARSFYELKGFRILTNQYAKLINANEFDLASLCLSQFVEVARAAGRTKLEEGLLEIITIQFNTVMRFAINHGIKNSESRHIYNLLFFYRQFILESVAAGHVEIVEEGCNYLKMYSAEIYRHSQDIAVFKFLVDVCVAEMRTILQYISVSKWPEKDQRHVLDMMLTMDDAPSTEPLLPGTTPARSLGVRVIQLGLALFYVQRGQHRLADAILDDFIGPSTRTDLRDLSSLMWTIVNRLQNEPETFWEVTDRGNRNIYHCPYTDSIPDLMDRFQRELSQLYSAEEVERFDRTVNGGKRRDSETIEPPAPVSPTPADPSATPSYRLRRR